MQPTVFVSAVQKSGADYATPGWFAAPAITTT